MAATSHRPDLRAASAASVARTGIRGVGCLARLRCRIPQADPCSTLRRSLIRIIKTLSSLDLHAGILDDLAPTGDFQGKMTAELFRRAADRLAAIGR